MKSLRDGRGPTTVIEWVWGPSWKYIRSLWIWLWAGRVLDVLIHNHTRTEYTVNVTDFAIGVSAPLQNRSAPHLGRTSRFNTAKSNLSNPFIQGLIPNAVSDYNQGFPVSGRYLTGMLATAFNVYTGEAQKFVEILNSLDDNHQSATLDSEMVKQTYALCISRVAFSTYVAVCTIAIILSLGILLSSQMRDMQ